MVDSTTPRAEYLVPPTPIGAGIVVLGLANTHQYWQRLPSSPGLIPEFTGLDAAAESAI